MTGTTDSFSDNFSIFKMFLFLSMTLLKSSENCTNALENLPLILVASYWLSLISRGLEPTAYNLESAKVFRGLFLLCLTCIAARSSVVPSSCFVSSTCSACFCHNNFTSFWNRMAVHKICPDFSIFLSFSTMTALALLGIVCFLSTEMNLLTTLIPGIELSRQMRTSLDRNSNCLTLPSTSEPCLRTKVTGIAMGFLPTGIGSLLAPGVITKSTETFVENPLFSSSVLLRALYCPTSVPSATTSNMLAATDLFLESKAMLGHTWQKAKGRSIFQKTFAESRSRSQSAELALLCVLLLRENLTNFVF